MAKGLVLCYVGDQRELRQLDWHIPSGLVQSEGSQHSAIPM